MRDPARIDEMLKDLGVIWHAYPDLRLGQLIRNLTPLTQSVATVEDDLIHSWMLDDLETIRNGE